MFAPLICLKQVLYPVLSQTYYDDTKLSGHLIQLKIKYGFGYLMTVQNLLELMSKITTLKKVASQF